MRTKSFFGGLMLVMLAASAGSAQVYVRGPSTGYLGIRFDEIVTDNNGPRNDRIVVRDVSKDSPAEKAGIKVEDEILRINGLTATGGKFSALARTLTEGDTVTLRIKRDGKERDYTVIAAKRPDRLAYYNREIMIAPDSIKNLMMRYLDTARMHLDSLHLPNIYIGRGDTAGVWSFRVPRGDSLFFKGDSSITRIFRAHPGEGIEWERELGPGMIFRSIELGARSIGGAELTEMDPGLADYFGATGLLTLKVLPETPAERAGLQPGDVVIKAKDRAIRTVSELRGIIAANPDGVKLEVRRKGQNKTLELKTRSR